jgi:hypothetical protein
MRRRGKPSQATKEAQEKRKLELQEEARLKAKEDRNLAKLKQRAEYEFLEMREEFKLITPERVLARIQRIATNPQERTTDRLQAETLLGKYLKLFTDKVEHSGKDGDAIKFSIDMSDDLEGTEVDVTPIPLKLVTRDPGDSNS